jgi:hypothetical protein
MSVLENDTLKKSLALSIACGKPVRSWAKRHNVDYRTAYEYSIQCEFRPLVELYRLRVADRMVGRLLRAARLAIRELLRLSTKSSSDTVRLSASREILSYWLKVSKHGSICGQVYSIMDRVNRLEAQKGEWRPTSPYRGGRVKC